MAPTVSSDAALTDYSGYLKVGMRKADLDQYKDSNIFNSVKKSFEKADSDGNGILSKDEIIAELNRDLKSVKRAKWRHVLLASATLAGAFITAGTGGIAAPLVFGSLALLNTACVVDKAMEQVLEQAE